MNKLKTVVALAVGVAAGYLASLFVSSKTRQLHKRKLKNSTNQLLNKYLSKEDRDKLSQLLDKTGSEATQAIEHLSELMEANVTAASQTFKELDKQKYVKAVTKTIDELRLKKSLNKKQLQKLKDYLEEDYQSFVKFKQASQE